MIPLPPCQWFLFLPASCLVLGTFGGAQEQPELGAEQLIKRRKGSTLDIKPYPLPWAAFHWHLCVWALSFCLSTFQWEPWEVPEVLSVPVLPAGGVYSLCCSGCGWLLKRKGNGTGGNVFLCSSRMQGSLPITFDWSLALVMCHLGKLSRLLATPASQGSVCPEASLPIYQWVS